MNDNPSERLDPGPIPDFLLVENRKPLTPEQQGKVAQAMKGVAQDDQRAPKNGDVETKAVRAEVEVKNKKKANARIGELEAKKAGADKAMPLSGKAALPAIAEKPALPELLPCHPPTPTSPAMSGDLNLTKYNAAKKALAEAADIDEVKDIRDKATAMRLYAMQAKDRVLIDQATEIRLRAERRAGELLKEMPKNKGAAPGKTGGKGKPVLDDTPKLSELNISKSQSSRWQKLASIPDDEFENAVELAKHKACTAVDRAQQPKPTKPKPERKQSAIETKPNGSAPPDVVAPDEELALLREFARFAITHTSLRTTGSTNRRKWRRLRHQVKAILRERENGTGNQAAAETAK